MTAERASPAAAPLQPGAVIGILGGGQLGRMLAMAAGRLGLATIIFDPDPHAPAAQFASRHICAAYEDRQALGEFAAACHVVTYEFENIPLEAARAIAAECPLRPGPLALEKSQDRLTEKSFLLETGLRTAPYHPVASLDELSTALAALDGGAILKTRRLGYDGKGQARLAAGAGRQELEAAWQAIGEQPAILEGLVAFELEISIIAARSPDGTVTCFDPAHNTHRDGILATSAVPAPVSPQVAALAADAAGRIVEALDYVGVLGVEFFCTAGGELLVNEIAPRVHNSGHWTEAACTVSQFEQHVRAISGWPLADPGRHSNCVMENLIGEDVERFAGLLGERDVCVHLYGKSETRKGRKMGHFTRLTGPAGREKATP